VAGVKPPIVPSRIVLVDKPGGLTSHDVVARGRRAFGTRKVGHAGTLDPMATGLLILGVGSSTRLLTYLVGLDKEYLATIRLGAATTTDDAEGEVSGYADAAVLDAVDERRLAASFAGQTGTITQVPSSVSAIKVDGKRAYARVRAGEDVVLAGRTVTIAEIERLSVPRRLDDDGHPSLDVDVRVVCSSGTYIRAIARDVGASLGVGGYLTSLRRTRIGPFEVADAVPLDELEREGAPSVAVSWALEPAQAAAKLFTVLHIDSQQAAALGHGQRIELDAAHPDADAPLAAVTTDGRLLGLVEVAKGRAKSIVNFPPDEYAPDSAPEAGGAP
jgi:tRNA pseudouridine55 synthase